VSKRATLQFMGELFALTNITGRLMHTCYWKLNNYRICTWILPFIVLN